MNSVPKLFSCSYADCWTEKHFSTEFGVLTSNHTHSHTLFWGCVSRWFGRALAWHARGHRFDPGNLHQKKHRTEMCGAFLVSAVLNSLSHGLRRDSSLGEGALGIAVMFPAKVQSLRTRQLRLLRRSRASSPKGEPSRKAHCESIRCNEEASGSALGSPFGRAGFAKQRLRGRGRRDAQMPLPVAAPPVKNAFGAFRRVRQTQNYKEPFCGIWSERSGDHFKSSRSQGTDCKAFTDLQPLNSYWTFAQSYGIILSAIAGIVHRLVYQPSKLRRWVRFPLPAPQDLNLEWFGSFLFIWAAILPTGGGNATIEP